MPQTGKQKLSLRLQAVADFVTKGNRVADIGTDHGFLAIYLIQSGQCPHAIAMDVREGPLERARGHIAKAGLTNQIDTRLSNGLAALAPGEAESAVIAGMGGLTVIQILEAAKAAPGWTSLREWILEPQSDLEKVRKYLRENGFFISRENLVLEDGKYYPVLYVRTAAPKQAEKSGTDKQRDCLRLLCEKIPDRDRVQRLLDRYGEWTVVHRHPQLCGLLKRDIARRRVILESLKESARKADHERRRQAVEKELEDLLVLRGIVCNQENEMRFETKVRAGIELARMAESVKGLEKREVYDRIPHYLYGNVRTRVCVVYGLRRTGKTTMLLQAIADMSEEDFGKAAYIKLRAVDEMDQLTRDLDRLYRAGYRYIFLDEVTLMEDFIDSAGLLSDIYVPMGMRIVLSGTDSLGFWFARDNELYDRERTFHTTFIPYREYSRILGIDSIDEYIRYGGTLKAGETDFDDEELLEEGVAFRDDESTRRYIDTAICRNIQRSLSCFAFGKYFGRLQSLYEAGELTGAINRIIEDMNHRFVLEVLTRPFVSHDLGITARKLKRERDPKKRTDILKAIDQEAVTQRLMKILDIRNQEEQKIGITPSHVAQIKKYLETLNLIVPCPVVYGIAGVEAEERILFTQPGMRYCQAQALVHSLMKDEAFRMLDHATMTYVAERLLQEIRGRMLEDMILLETSKALGKNYKVCKLMFASGEFDMVIFDQKGNACAVYEIKHSAQYVREQARHLLDEEKLLFTVGRFGRLAGRFVLYLGKDLDTEDGIAYRNAEQFLKNLPQISMESGLEE